MWWMCPFSGSSWVQVEHNVAEAEVYVSRLATIDVDRKLGGVPPLLG